MKKFVKFMFGTVAIASIAAGAYYIYKTFIKKDSSDDFDDFEDDFEDFDSEDEAESDTREYVPINIADEKSSSQEKDDSDADDKEVLPEDEQ